MGFSLSGDQRSSVPIVGLAYDDLGKSSHAIELYEQYLAISRETDYPLGEGLALFNRGVSHRKLGNFAQAISDLEAAREIFGHIQSPYAETARQKLAEWRSHEE